MIDEINENVSRMSGSDEKQLEGELEGLYNKLYGNQIVIRAVSDLAAFAEDVKNAKEHVQSMHRKRRSNEALQERIDGVLYAMDEIDMDVDALVTKLEYVQEFIDDWY